MRSVAGQFKNESVRVGISGNRQRGRKYLRCRGVRQPRKESN